MERFPVRLPGSRRLVAVGAKMLLQKPAAASVAVLFLMAAGCTRASGPGEPGGRHSWTVPDELRVAMQEPKSLDPLLSSSTYDGFVARLMFEPLLSADPHGNPVPMLAVSVPSIANRGVSGDGLTVTYHLRPDARWSDGVPVSAADVKWSWQAIMNPKNDVVTRHGYDDVASIDTPDPHTVVVHLKARFAPFVNTFFAESDQPYDVAPAHVLARYPDINQVDFNAAPAVVDGPFRFVRWQRGEDLEFAANPTFFNGRPGLDRVHLRFVANDNTAANLLATHAVDYVVEAPVDLYPAYARLPDARTVLVELNAFEGLEFNLRHPPLDDPAVRRAIAAALDKASMVESLAHGQGKAATEDIPDWMWAYDPAVPAVRYDPAESARILASRGWRAGDDGILRKNGQPLSLLLTSDTDDTHRRESLLVQAALRRVGIEVEVKYYPESMLYAPAGLGGIMHAGKFDMILEPWVSGIDPDNSSQFTCANFSPNGYNDSHYCNPDMEAAQHVALARYGRPQRKAAYAAIESLLARDNPAVFFWWTRALQPVSVDFRGFDPNPTVESWNAWQWRI